MHYFLPSHSSIHSLHDTPTYRQVKKFLIIILFLVPTVRLNAQKTRTADVVVYGGTSGAVMAAVQVKKMGRSVILVSPDKHLGGLSSGGLGYTDSGDKEVIGGISKEFYQQLYRHYQKPESWVWQKKEEYGNKGQNTVAMDGSSMWIFEPHVAEAIFNEYIKNNKIEIYTDEWLDRSANGVTKTSNSIRSIKTLAGNRYNAKIFIDATYEGDLMAAAGVSYHVGREANSQYNEKWNGVQTNVYHHDHQFRLKIDPYKVPGDKNSGLLPEISSQPPGEKGSADKRLQAYCFRLCMSNNPDNQVPFPKPAGYDPGRYEVLKRLFAAGWRDVFRKFDPVPNKKTDTNNHGPFSSDYIGKNYDYPDATYARRKEIIAEHERYQKGLLYFLSNDESVPDSIKAEMHRWGLAKDEFKDNGNWPHQLYIREARRMIGDFVMTEADALGKTNIKRSIGMGSYALDAHNAQRYVTDSGYVQNEGDIGAKPDKPYGIDYGAILPKEKECSNLLVPVCVSSTHIAYGSIRMEPVFMILGQSAAVAAVLSIDNKLAPQKLPYETLRKELLKYRQVLEYPNKAVTANF